MSAARLAPLVELNLPLKSSRDLADRLFDK